MEFFESILYLDDMRVPNLRDVDLVRNYDEFVRYIEERGMPDLISFDHDLAREHYPAEGVDTKKKIPYTSYTEKTGLHCARFLIENRLPVRHWAVHSLNVQGRANIERELRRYCPRGEVRGLQLPYEIRQRVDARAPAPSGRSFAGSSLLQFDEDIPLESWERGLFESFART